MRASMAHVALLWVYYSHEKMHVYRRHAMSQITVPLDTMVPISKFSRGGASAEFAKVADGVPVTVLKNSEPAYFIISVHDYREFCEAERRLANLEARYEAEHGIGEKFESIEDLMADLND